MTRNYQPIFTPRLLDKTWHNSKINVSSDSAGEDHTAANLQGKEDSSRRASSELPECLALH